MLVRIGRLECRYRLPAGVTASGEFASRVERLQPRLWQAVSQHLEHALENDPTVYVLRSLDSRLSLGRLSAKGEQQLQGRWVDHLASQVLGSLDAGGENMQCFADQAEFVAQFLSDLLDGDAWDKWYYGAFQHVQSQPLNQALVTVLQENRNHLGGILAGIHRRGPLEKLLAQIEPRLLTDLGYSGFLPGQDATASQTLFYFASQLVGQLGLWAGQPPESMDLDGYLQTGRLPVDWSDRRSLAEGLLNVLRFLSQRGLIPSSTSPDFSGRLDLALEELDWMDTAYLRDAIPAVLGSQLAPDLPLPPGRRDMHLSARQRRLLEDLSAALAQHGDQLDRSDPDSAANRLRMAAWLVARDRNWLEDPQANTLLERLLSAWAALASASDPLGLLHRAEAGAVGVFPSQLQPIVELGKSGTDVLAQLLGAAGALAKALYSPCAGVSLLLRMLVDTRLTTLSDYLPWEALPPGLTHRTAFLLGLLLRWAGQDAVTEGQVDPGLTLLAGLKQDRQPLLLEDLNRAFIPLQTPSALQKFNPVWLRILSDQRLLDGETIHLYRLPAGEDLRLLATDAAGLCPLGWTNITSLSAPDLIQSWLADWTLACGLEPQVVCDEELRDWLPDSTRAVILTPGADDLMASEHRRFREELVSALQAISAYKHDLTLTLVALAGLRLWARWLPNFGSSSVSYLLTNFVRCAGRLYLEPGRLRVELAPLPLDMVLQMAGYTAPLEALSWLEDRRLDFIL